MGVVVDSPSGAPDVVPIAFVVPMQGATGLYGPSCVACGQLAAEELNAGAGIGGRRVELVLVDAGRAPEVVAADVARLVDTGAVEAVAGWHISAVRQAITRRVGGRVVYSYAAMHEGRDDTPGLFMLGERPVNQVLPAARWLAEHRDVRRWAVVGNDYVFPRVSGRAVRESLRGTGSSVVRETYVPLGTSDFRSVLAGLEAGHGGGQGGVDGVLMLLMGQDAVHFNRQFAAAGLGGVLTRLSPAVEENTLLGAGAGAHDDLWAAAAYFEGMDTVESGDLAERYARRFGEWAPTLNVVGESCYEAVQFLARLHRATGSLRVADAAGLPEGWFYGGPRGLVRLRGNLADQDVYLAQADGVQFRVRERIAGV
ncbi:substrate-binding domain-containing protein [Nocardioides daphniae]|uniref:Leucine-binding protein domain-containing protein n=1 Tax=Nocardioides daphniae TaxID=402297 RepID=A0ABQ1Q5J1_9ACTN|nr:substrate-binding domain-containing protein [Nocardioides daphniae]GGD13520.1 hypothetical protein GCM10007231_10700 [Nocardioides daphniae]